MADIFAMVDTWNNGATTFTAVKMNVTDTASAAGSLLMDLQKGGVSQEKTDKNGNKTLLGSIRTKRGTAADPGWGFDSSDTGFFIPNSNNIGVVIGTTDAYRMRVADFTIGTALLGWGTNIDAPDLLIGRDAANTLAQRNGTAAQAFRLYKNYANAGADQQRLFFDFNGSSGAARIATTWGGTGTAFDLELGGGIGQWRFDTNGNLRGFTATGGLGYTTGAGGAVTQITSKSTGVTLNTVTGIITMQAASLAADTTVSFTLTDSAIAATDAVIVLHESAGTLGAYSFASTAAAGSASIAVHNNTPGALAEAIVLRFVVLKSANA